MYQNVQTPFAIMIPGQIAMTNFQFMNNCYVQNIQNPALIPNLAFFLMSPLEEGKAACLYCAYGQNEFEFLGAIGNARPSEIIATNFSINPNINIKTEVQLVISIQIIDETLQQQILQIPIKQSQYTMNVALHLDKYLQEHPKDLIINQNQQQMLVVPTAALDKWIQRFQEKYNIDPNFLYK